MRASDDEWAERFGADAERTFLELDRASVARELDRLHADERVLEEILAETDDELERARRTGSAARNAVAEYPGTRPIGSRP